MLKSIKRLTVVGALAAAAFTTLVPQDANALSVTYNGAANGFRTVNVGVPNFNGSAGGFSFTNKATNEKFVAWCFDLRSTISPGGEYTYELATLNPTAPQLNNPPFDVPPTFNVDRVQALFDSSYSVALNTVGGSNAETSAAFQLALWETIYDTNFSLANVVGFSFAGSSTNSDVNILAAGFLTAAQTRFNSNPTTTKWKLSFWDGATSNNPDAQDLVTAVPLPAAAWLLLAVSGGLIAAKRRRAAKA
jgi:hypothetical protein